MKTAYSFILISLLILSSCAPNEKITEISFSPLEPVLKIDDTQENIIIRNKEDLLKLKSSKTPDVDFNEKTVLGFRGSVGGCSDPEFDIKIIRDDSKKQYSVNINVRQRGMCKKLILYQKFIAIDKIKKNYEVVFQTEVIPGEERIFHTN